MELPEEMQPNYIRLPEWYRNPVLDEPLGVEVWIKSTPTFRGVVIHPGYLTNAPGEYSDRRYSVAIIHPGNHFELLIGSTFYIDTGFDTEDVDEPLEKFLAGEFKILYRVPTTATIEMQELSEWSGSSQELQTMFGHYVGDLETNT